jgi:hypothetical protein
MKLKEDALLEPLISSSSISFSVVTDESHYGKHNITDNYNMKELDLKSHPQLIQ